MKDHSIFEVDEFHLQSGTTLSNARLAYKTRGTLNHDKSNVILYFTHFGGKHSDCQFLIGEGKALDPSKYFIINTNMMGNGLSSSPDNTPTPQDGPRFPDVTIYDNVQLQYKLLESLGIQKIALALGHSMGALQAFHWAALYPDMVERIAPICGAARVSRHNSVFLKGMQAVLACDPAFHDGEYATPPINGLAAVGRAWAPWAPSEWFYREEHYKTLGYDTIGAFLTDYWEKTFISLDANNMLSQISTWLQADISDNDLYKSDFQAALAAISARAIVMPGAHDTYFPPEDSAFEVMHMQNAELRPIPSSWGHWAGSGRNPEDNAFIDKALKDLLSY